MIEFHVKESERNEYYSRIAHHMRIAIAANRDSDYELEREECAKAFDLLLEVMDRQEAIAAMLMTDNRTTELRTIVEALDNLAWAITWTMPNDSASVRAYLKEAFDAIGKLKELIPDER